MKSILALLVLVWSVHSNALPVAHSLTEISKGDISKVTSIPGSQPGDVKLAITLIYSNQCVAEQNTLVYNGENTPKDLQLFTYWNSDILCTSDFQPVYRVNLINVNYSVGEEVTINNEFSFKVEAPALAMCTKDMCSDGNSRDPYTCACSDGFTR